MNIEGENIMKLCSFYVSDWHLVTMLLPYISKKVNEETKIATILKDDIKNNVETLVQKLNLKNEQKILDIDWNSKNGRKYTNINNIIESNIGNDILIVVNGDKEYIKSVNENIDKYIEKNIKKIEKTNTTIKVVDCYEIVEFNGSIIEILDNHDKILNTAGEKEISEVFEDYTKKEKVEELEFKQQ